MKKKHIKYIRHIISFFMYLIYVSTNIAYLQEIFLSAEQKIDNYCTYLHHLAKWGWHISSPRNNSDYKFVHILDSFNFWRKYQMKL